MHNKRGNMKTFEKFKEENTTYAVIKINWRSSSSEVSYLHHSSDNLFNNIADANLVCDAFNAKKNDNQSFMVVEINNIR